MTEHSLTADRLRGSALSAVIVGAFAAGWGISGSLALPGAARAAALAVVVAVTAALVGLAVQLVRGAPRWPDAGGAAGNPFRTRDYQLAVLAEIIAIPLAGRLLTAAGRPDAIMPAVAAIVGLHFFGLIRAFRSWRFAIVGGAMVLLALASLAIPPLDAAGQAGDTLDARAAVVGLGSAVLLWAGVLPIALGTWQQMSAEDRATRAAASTQR